MIKVIYCMRRRPDLSAESFLAHWRLVHAPIVLRNREILRVASYVQTTPLDHHYSARVERRADMVARYDGVAELTWSCAADFTHAFESAQAIPIQRELAKDELNFIDILNSARWICDEARLIGG